MLKRLMKFIKYKYVFRKKGVKFSITTNFANNNVSCEGMNAFGTNTSFSGSIGYGSYIGNNSEINAVIGRFCSIASDVKVITGTHPSSCFVSTHPAFFSTNKPSGISYVSENSFNERVVAEGCNNSVYIGNDVWIGSDVLILPGLHIGDGAIVGAGAVVTKDVPPYAVAVGVPARVIKYRFSEEEIRELNRIRWWEKDEAWLKMNVKDFGNINTFLSNQKRS